MTHRYSFSPQTPRTARPLPHSEPGFSADGAECTKCPRRTVIPALRGEG